ncbi:hypothetical protein GCM10022199_14740 [Marihabitans asiaticum]|uniref:Uncharacterized protein n=1 Tax=Marihabitans asiaticum TaxID=415218 RepID=A0A560W882_9MICO|nr:hypothetical protein [Marihabitans asiaticum]TWD13833.1 hypothetical protein FB557_2474 [Marihabitans asiaticum]
MSADLQGDPGSLASLVSTLRRHERALAGATDDLTRAQQQAADGWVGRVAVRHRHGLDDLAARAGASRAELTRLASALEEYADALSEAKGELRRVEEQAAAVGLELRDGAVVRRPGVLGEADASHVAEQDATIERLQRALARSRVLLERRRSVLVDHAESLQRSLR